jgi:hypothetical protein
MRFYASELDTLAEQKTLKLINSLNNKGSFLGTIIGARTTEPANYHSSHVPTLKEVIPSYIEKSHCKSSEILNNQTLFDYD